MRTHQCNTDWGTSLCAYSVPILGGSSDILLMLAHLVRQPYCRLGPVESWPAAGLGWVPSTLPPRLRLLPPPAAEQGGLLHPRRHLRSWSETESLQNRKRYAELGKPASE